MPDTVTRLFQEREYREDYEEAIIFYLKTKGEGGLCVEHKEIVSLQAKCLLVSLPKTKAGKRGLFTQLIFLGLIM